jgi:hypothetical protein
MMPGMSYSVKCGLIGNLNHRDTEDTEGALET